MLNRLPFALVFIVACGPLNVVHYQQLKGGNVTAALSSVTLADDCSTAAAAPSETDGRFADCAAAGCGCTQSSMQLQFISATQANAKIEIRAVRLKDPRTGKILQTLRHREPQQWSVDKYIPWDETVLRGATVKATYKLTSPGYSSSGYSTTYTVEVELAVDGQVQTLSIEASLEPPVVT